MCQLLCEENKIHVSSNSKKILKKHGIKIRKVKGVSDLINENIAMTFKPTAKTLKLRTKRY